MISEVGITKELQEQFGGNQMNQRLSHEQFAERLKSLNADHPFDGDLTKQLFEKMQNEMNTADPSLEIFPKVYIDAFDYLDRKIDIEDEHIRVLNINIDENEQLLEQLKYQHQMNILPEKKQVPILFFQGVSFGWGE
jgi:glutaredoxin